MQWWSFEGKGQLRVDFCSKIICFSLTFKQVIKKGQNLTFKDNFQCQESSKFFCLKNLELIFEQKSTAS